MRSTIGPVFLTLLALVGLAAIVYFIMHFTTGHAGLPITYWLVPVFGAGGGAVGGVLRNENRLVLSKIEPPDKISLGVIGDISLGLGGACVIVFLFGNTLRINQADALSNVLLISMSFIAGVFGKRLVEVAGERFLKEAAAAGKAAGERAGAQAAEQKVEEKVREDVAPSAAIAYGYAATSMNNLGNSSEALKMAEQALRYDPVSIYAYVEKGRALKRLAKIEDALATVEQALQIAPDDERLLYNRICYMSLLGRNIQEILADLKKVCEAVPQYCEQARRDPDLDAIRNLPQFREMMLATLDKALSTRPDDTPEAAILLYSRACYMSALKQNSAEILRDLTKALEIKPELRERAHIDPDLESVRSLPEFSKLLGRPA